MRKIFKLEIDGREPMVRSVSYKELKGLEKLGNKAIPTLVEWVLEENNYERGAILKNYRYEISTPPGLEGVIIRLVSSIVNSRFVIKTQNKIKSLVQS